MVSDQAIAESLESLFRETNPKRWEWKENCYTKAAVRGNGSLGVRRNGRPSRTVASEFSNRMVYEVGCGREVSVSPNSSCLRVINEEAPEQALSAAVTCTILAAVGPQLLVGISRWYEVDKPEHEIVYDEMGIVRGPKCSVGDSARVIFTGTVVVIPDIMAPGARAECCRKASQCKDTASGNEGVRGLRALGVIDPSYHLAFIANFVQVDSLVVVSDGRRDTNMRNRKRDADDEDN
ncbi:hypothetical protein RHSIM_Rhsim13G0136600 [Rhododendron simsii]|uniref:Uncharacterized protein n=1 Tax=Rhododendron simsii TaxID=118357 RepID=A0A834FZ73_RHOSS|nr:hypothetical protein RHSIM_Rhsim13G0136600 [Rhododendron simsii]